MERARADHWARTFAQLMAERKPQDVWALLPQESLVAGCLDGDGLQYRLKGLSRLKCSHCPWAWSSAHVLILFHLWWDQDSHKGLVKMRVWGQPCRLCSPSYGDCEVSPLNVHIFLSKLVLYILRRCYGDNLSPGQCPEICFGHCCEACDLGICFLQQSPDPAWGPVARSPNAVEGSHLPLATLGSNSSVPRGTAPPNLSSSHTAKCTRGHDSNLVTISLSVCEFIESPLSESHDFLSEDDSIVTVPFSLVDMNMVKEPIADGCASPGCSSLGPQLFGKGSIHLSGRTTAKPKGKGILVNIRDPIFQGKGLLSDIKKTFELQGFLFKARGASSSPVGVAKGQGPISCSSSLRGLWRAPLTGPYIVGLRPDGEGSLTFSLSFARAIGGKDAFAHLTEGKKKKGSHQGLVACGNSTLSEVDADSPTSHEEDLVTFPFTFTEDEDTFADAAEVNMKEGGYQGLFTTGLEPCSKTNVGGLTFGSLATSSSPGAIKGRESSSDSDEDREKKDGGQGTASEEPCPQASVDGSICISEGSITVPFSIFDIIIRKGPSCSANESQSNGFVTYGYYKKRLPRSRFGKSKCGCRQEEDFCSGRTCLRPQAEPYEDLWIWVSVSVCIFWLMCMCRLEAGIFPQQA
ncbi:receptor-transporting protein 5 [Nycticebus coucang]|uniref:receptor-transporting protein 5 n=1 Tax=Nycticebus coucang TaxID=9470 RepID=UPI00234D3C58|nr:receptor-transporting protein 5 [Nycticebus coucang]